MAPVLQGEPGARWGATQGSLRLVSPESWSREGWPKREVAMINSVNFVLAGSSDSSSTLLVTLWELKVDPRFTKP